MKPLVPMADVWARFRWNVTHLFTNDVNPYVLAGEGDSLPKRRTAFEDITHSIKNIFVEGARHLRKPK